MKHKREEIKENQVNKLNSKIFSSNWKIVALKERKQHQPTQLINGIISVKIYSVEF